MDNLAYCFVGTRLTVWRPTNRAHSAVLAFKSDVVLVKTLPKCTLAVFTTEEITFYRVRLERTGLKLEQQGKVLPTDQTRFLSVLQAGERLFAGGERGQVMELERAEEEAKVGLMCKVGKVKRRKADRNETRSQALLKFLGLSSDAQGGKVIIDLADDT